MCRMPYMFCRLDPDEASPEYTGEEAGVRPTAMWGTMRRLVGKVAMGLPAMGQAARQPIQVRVHRNAGRAQPS